MTSSQVHTAGPARPWYADGVVGLHFDLHASDKESGLMGALSQAELTRQLRRCGVDWAQCDAKGHPGISSYASRLELSNVAPRLGKDLVAAWRTATLALGIPLHVHYSGLWDESLALRRPAWRRIDAAGQPDPQRLCPRSPYAEEHLAPAIRELADGWGIDGAWVDGEMCLTEACWCERCTTAFRAEGSTCIPLRPGDDGWSAWMDFSRRSYHLHADRWTAAIRASHPRLRLASAWMGTLHDPGQGPADVDWHSGDDANPLGIDNIRCEGRFLATRGKPWDIMLWMFHGGQTFSPPEVLFDPARRQSAWTLKSFDHLAQEAGLVLSCGGRVQLYENPGPVRDGTAAGLAPWRVERIAAAARFCRKRKALVDSTAWEHIAVLHSEHHAARHITGTNLLWSVDVAPIAGAVHALAGSQLGVDVHDAWSLLPVISSFPLIVVPEQTDLSTSMIAALQDYVRAGGKLLLTGAGLFARFPGAFLGCSLAETAQDQVWHLPVGDGVVPVGSQSWAMLRPTTGQPWGRLTRGHMPGYDALPHPAGVLHHVGAGTVLTLGCDLFRFHAGARFGLGQTLAKELVAALRPNFPVTVLRSPQAVEVIPRRLGNGTLAINLVNRLSGNPTVQGDANIDDVPTIGPIRLSVRCPQPRAVRATYESTDCTWRWSRGSLTVALTGLRLQNTIRIS